METTRQYREKTIPIKDYKKRIRRNRRNRKIVFILFLLVVFFSILHFAPWFKINKIEVTGTNILTAGEVISASTVGYGRNVFRTSTGVAEKRVMELPYVRDVKVARKFPATIKITVTECEISGYIKYSDTYIYLDEKGKMLEQSKMPPSITVPLIESFNPQKFVSGEIIQSKNEGKAQYLIDILEILKKNGLLNRATLIKIPDIHSLSVTIDNQLEVFVGENNMLDYKIGFLTVKAAEKLGENIRGYLNVSSGDKAVYKQY